MMPELSARELAELVTQGFTRRELTCPARLQAAPDDPDDPEPEVDITNTPLVYLDFAGRARKVE